MSSINDFEIENGILKKYTGPGGDVEIPDSVTVIGDRVFKWCSSLTSIVIPDSVTAIGDSAFSNCSSLTSIVIPNSVTGIGDGAFGGCSCLTSIVIPEIVTAISNGAFSYCSCLTSIVIPDSVTTIGDSAFRNCSSLTSIVIPDSVTTIGDGAFKDCYRLTSIVIPDSVTAINDGAFGGCSSLKSIVIPNSVTAIGDGAFGSCSLKSIVIPDSVTAIGDLAFRYCSSLTSVVIPKSVTAIGDGAFENCNSLTSVVIPESVTTIGNRAFGKCGNLEKVVFRNRDVAFEASSFSSCDKLKEMVVPEEFLATTQRRPAMLIPFMKAFTRKEVAYIWLFQDDKWLAAAQQSRDDVNQIAQIIVEILPQIEKLTPKVQTRLKEFVDWSYPEISSKYVQELCDMVAMKDPKIAKKFLATDAVKRGLSSERVVEQPEPIEEYALSLLEKRPLHPNATVFTKGIPYAGQEKLCTPRLLNILVSEYLYLYDTYQKTANGEMTTYVKLDVPTNAVIPVDADQIAKALNRNMLSDALENMVYSCSKAYRPWMYAYARFATEASVKKLLHHPPAGSSSKVRYWRENLDEAMLFSETKAAIEHLEKKGLLEKYTRIRGMSVQEFRDQYFLPNWKMDENCVINSNFGRLGFALTSDFGLRPIELATGKELRSVSAKTDPDAAQEFKTLKKEVTDFYKKRVEYIRSIYITAEKTTVQHWQKTYYSNPILRPVAEKVIWSDGAGETFMVVDGAIRTVDGASYEPKDFVQIAHVLDLTVNQIDAWQHYLQNGGKKLLIEQVWEPIAAVKDISLYGHMILSKEDRNEFKRALGRKAIAIRSENDYSEFDHRANKYVYSDTGTMHVGNALQIRYQVKEDTGETTLLEFLCRNKEMTRELNTILFELGRVCVKSAIRQDAILILSEALSAGYTAAQVAEFIRLAQDCGNTQATAILLEHQQNHFADLDPMAEFTLD